MNQATFKSQFLYLNLFDLLATVNSVDQFDQMKSFGQEKFTCLFRRRNLINFALPTYLLAPFTPC